ncbi:MAG: type IV pilus assembly protein PilN [Litorivivens sp.]|jgi:type IV pilus assembly protein PilN
MMLNLLPHRQWAMARKRKAWAVSMVLAALVGVLVAVAISVWLARQLAAQRLASSSLQQAIAALDGQLKDKAQVKTDLVQLRLRETSLQALRDESQLAGALLQELAVHLPEGLYLTALTQDGDKVRINGAARSGQEVFELLRQMASGGQWLVRPELIEVAAAPAASVRQGEPVGTPFSMRAWLQRPELPASTLD